MEKMKDMAKEQILFSYGKLTMKCCEKVPAERKEQPGEEERGGEGQEGPGPGQVYH
jgi:hypothetical protein